MSFHLAASLYETQAELLNYFQMWLTLNSFIHASFISVAAETSTRHTPIQQTGKSLSQLSQLYNSIRRDL